jgi:hypothetical protein
MIVAGNTYRFTPNETGVLKDGAIWDLTGATVTLILTDPANVETRHVATLTAPTAGLAEYLSLVTDIVAVGQWLRKWRIVQGAIDVTSPAVPFFVVAGA